MIDCKMPVTAILNKYFSLSISIKYVSVDVNFCVDVSAGGGTCSNILLFFHALSLKGFGGRLLGGLCTF